MPSSFVVCRAENGFFSSHAYLRPQIKVRVQYGNRIYEKNCDRWGGKIGLAVFSVFFFQLSRNLAA